nr:hypothetical protein [Tanacetum cinerariifolium]
MSPKKEEIRTTFVAGRSKFFKMVFQIGYSKPEPTSVYWMYHDKELSYIPTTWIATKYNAKKPDEDPYKAIRQAYLVGMDTESEPFEDPIETEAPEIVRIFVLVPPAMSSGLSASIAEVAAMSDSTFRKRFRSSYESLPSSSLPDLSLRKCYQGTSKLVEDDEEEEEDEEEDDKEEDEDIEESSDSDSESEDAKYEGPTAEDEDPAAGDEGLVVETAVDEPLGLGYEVLRRREIALGEGRMPSVFEVDPEDGIAYIDVLAYPPPAPPAQTPPLIEWSSGSLPVSPAPSIVPSPISSPMIPLTIPSPVASPVMAETGGFLIELGARVEM